MNIEQLHYLQELHRYGSINQAANHLFMSPAALSKSITRLENQLGLVLFTRTSNGVEFTEQGRVLLNLAQTFMEGLQHLQKNQVINELEVFGDIDILVSKDILDVIENFTCGFYHRYSNINVIWHEHSVNDIFRILSKKAMIAITYITQAYWERFTLKDQFEMKKIIQGELVLQVSCDHVLASKKSVSIKELNHYPIYVIDSNTDKLAYDVLFDVYGVVPKKLIVENNKTLVHDAVRQQNGVQLISALNAIPKNLTRVSLLEDTSFSICCLKPIEYRLSEPEQVFIKNLTEFYQSLL